MPEYITDGIEISSDDSDRQDYDEENSNKENSDEENSDERILMKKIKYSMCLVLIFWCLKWKSIIIFKAFQMIVRDS